MAKVIAVMGESGSGKTTAMEHLPPEETFYIDADGKGLSWKGWREQYNAEKKNYFRTSDKMKVLACLQKIDLEQKKFRYAVVDTINGIMVDDEFSRMAEKGYDKWVDLAASVYGIIRYALQAREDLTVIFLCHSQTERDDNGYNFTHIKTSGKKLDKIVLESKFTTVLLSKCVNGNYVFETKSKNSTAKTPKGAFSEDTIPNDIMLVIDALKEY